MPCLSVAKFFWDDSGAVTVDFVVLTAAVVGLGVSTVAAVRTGTSNLSTDTQTSLSGATVAQLGDFSGGGGTNAFAPVGCAGGMDAVREYAQAMSDSGAWPSGTFDYDFGDVEQIIHETQSYDNGSVSYLRDVWRGDYVTRPEVFASISNMVEMAVAECVAAERGL